MRPDRTRWTFRRSAQATEIVSWVLYALLGVALPGAAKAGVAFAAALAARWLVAAGLRRLARTASRAVRPTALDLPAPPADRAAA